MNYFKGLNKYLKAAIFAVCLSIPFISIASVCWLVQENAKPDEPVYFFIANIIFMLGAPLTYLPSSLNLIFSYWMTLLIANFLFLVQWIIWSQIFVLFFGKKAIK